MSRQSYETKLLREAAQKILKNEPISEGLWVELEKHNLVTEQGIKECQSIMKEYPNLVA